MAVTLGGFAQLSHASDIGINVILEGEVQPGVYGRVEIGNESHPRLVYADPRVIVVDEHHHDRPIYLHVPPGHAKHWSKHCREYRACDRPVYFVRSAEYDDEQHNHHHHPSENGEKGKGKDKGKSNHQH